jgi:hypothetical protein
LAAELDAAGAQGVAAVRHAAAERPDAPSARAVVEARHVVAVPGAAEVRRAGFAVPESAEAE